jgi:serine phosphatase RsbU (regulator of sigma subunit)
VLKQRQSLGPKEMLASALADLHSFRSPARKPDDLTVMVVRREK